MEAIEVIHWKDAAATLPDDGVAVLIEAAPGYDDEPVWIGFREDGEWFVDNGGPGADPHGAIQVLHWADMPRGIKAQLSKAAA